MNDARGSGGATTTVGGLFIFHHAIMSVEAPGVPGAAGLGGGWPIHDAAPLLPRGTILRVTGYYDHTPPFQQEVATRRERLKLKPGEDAPGCHAEPVLARRLTHGLGHGVRDGRRLS